MVPNPSGVATAPTNIGRYDLVCPLGEGGMARVYLALQRGAFDANKVVVLKHIRQEYAADEEFLAMFVDEARIAVRLSHPNVVHTYEVIAEAPVYCLVMEYLEGQTLTQLLKRVGRDRLDRDDHIWILSQILAGLSYAHDLKDFDGTPLGIVHRDVTPSNVVITSSGDVKLLDFGIAKAAGAVSLTQQGVVKGKIGYAAPEQCLGQAVDHRADIYSVGVMLWEAIAGKRRTTGTTPLAAFRTRIESGEPPIESVVPDVAPELAAICQLALARDPDERYATTRDFQRALERYLSKRGRSGRGDALAGLVQSSHAEEITRLRKAVESHVSSRQALGLGSYYRSPGSVSAMRAVTESRSDSSSSDNDPFQGERARKRRLLIAAGVAVTFGLGVAAFATRRPPEPALAAVITHAAPTAAPAPESQTPRPTTSLRLIVAASPPSARIKLDGQSVDNPYVGELPADGSQRELRITADGYAPIERSLVMTHDQELKLSLSREVGARRAPVEADGREPAAPPVVERASAAAPAPPKSAPIAASPKPAPAIEPGADLRGVGTTRAGRKIDNKDPYSP